VATVGWGLVNKVSWHSQEGKKTNNILLQVNKQHSKNALIFKPISISESALHILSFELKYLYDILFLITLNYIGKL
jgi:hypothetical protein